MKKVVPLLMAALLIAAVTPIALAQSKPSYRTVIIKVPVELSNVDDDVAPAVTCEVLADVQFDKANGTPWQKDLSIGKSSTEIPLYNGSYKGTVDVALQYNGLWPRELPDGGGRIKLTSFCQLELWYKNVESLAGYALERDAKGTGVRAEFRADPNAELEANPELLYEDYKLK